MAESFLKNAGDERQIFLKYCKEIINERGCDELKVWFKFRQPNANEIPATMYDGFFVSSCEKGRIYIQDLQN